MCVCAGMCVCRHVVGRHVCVGMCVHKHVCGKHVCVGMCLHRHVCVEAFVCRVGCRVSGP